MQNIVQIGAQTCWQVTHSLHKLTTAKVYSTLYSALHTFHIQGCSFIHVHKKMAVWYWMNIEYWDNRVPTLCNLSPNEPVMKLKASKSSFFIVKTWRVNGGVWGVAFVSGYIRQTRSFGLCETNQLVTSGVALTLIVRTGSPVQTCEAS